MMEGKDWPVDEGEDWLALKIIAEALMDRALENMMGSAWVEAHRNATELPLIETETVLLLIPAIGGNQRVSNKEEKERPSGV